MLPYDVSKLSGLTSETVTAVTNQRKRNSGKRQTKQAVHPDAEREGKTSSRSDTPTSNLPPPDPPPSIDRPVRELRVASRTMPYRWMTTGTLVNIHQSAAASGPRKHLASAHRSCSSHVFHKKSWNRHTTASIPAKTIGRATSSPMIRMKSMPMLMMNCSAPLLIRNLMMSNTVLTIKKMASKMKTADVSNTL